MIHGELKAVDFFCSGGGMTEGFKKSGIDVIGGIDIDSHCQETYTKNHPKSKFILADIKDLKFSTLQCKLNIKRKDDNLIFIGCSPCQYWSNIKTIKAKSEESKNLLSDFQRFVDHFRPGYLVIENVPGILNKAEESPLKAFLEFLDERKYHYKFEVVNASHHGVPQTRRRFLLIASRVRKEIFLPVADKEYVPTVKKFIGDRIIFPPISAGHKDESKHQHTTASLSDKNLQRLRLTPHDGGTRKAWSETDLQLDAYKHLTGGFEDIYGRMYWDRPGPTITTKFLSISNGRFAHPEQDRGISLREGATLQTFDLKYKFYATSLASMARIIGNAVPPELSKRIGKAIITTHDNRK